MNLQQLLNLPSLQARVLRALWFALPVAIVVDCLVLIVLAFKYRFSTAAFGHFLATSARVHTLASWFGLAPLLVWTLIFWWQQRRRPALQP